eukprot:PRCOL_00005618-RA
MNFSWARANAASLEAAEGAIGAAAWFVPERFASSEAVLETVSSALGVFGVVNAYVLGDADGDDDAGKGQGAAGRAADRPKHRPALPWPVMISLVQQVELLTEMIAEMLQGRRNKYGTVAAIEAVKAVLRLAALLDGGGHTLMGGCRSAAPGRRMVLDKGALSLRALGGLKARAAGTASASAELERIERAAEDAKQAVEEAHAPWWKRLRGRRRSGGERCAILAPQAVLPPAVAAAVASARRARLAGEVLYITRPVLYALMLRRYGRTAWMPWLSSLGIDLASDALRVRSRQQIEALLRAVGHAGEDGSSASSAGAGEGEDKLAAAVKALTLADMDTATKAALVRALGHPQLQEERAETGRRRALLLYYLARSPIFNILAKRPLEAVGRSAEGVPLLGTIVSFLVEIAVGSQYYYFYTSSL